MAERIQRKRIKGWKMPVNTVYVGRPSKWGNPFKVGIDAEDLNTCLLYYEYWICDTIGSKNYLYNSLDISELKGKNLACWCPLDKPCHADILLRLANQLN